MTATVLDVTCHTSQTQHVTNSIRPMSDIAGATCHTADATRHTLQTPHVTQTRHITYSRRYTSDISQQSRH